MASVASSSDSDDDQYGNFQKYKKRHQMKKRKAAAPPLKTSPKKFESQFTALRKLDKKQSSDEASDTEKTIEQLIEEQKRKKPVEKVVEIEILNDSLVLVDDDTEDVPGPSTRTRSQNSQDAKKKKKEQQQQYQGKAQALLDEMRLIERQQKMEEKAHQDAVEYIANKIEAPVITLAADDMVTVLLGLMTDPEFRHIFKIKYTDRFDKIFLDYGSKAGFDRPEDIILLWDTGDEYKTVKYFDTPQKLNMPINGTVNLAFNPKQGAQRESREEGEIKIKLNLKAEKNPLERFIHKEMPFGEFKVKICAELKISPAKVRFFFDGEKLSDDTTPDELDMEDFDCVDMHVNG
uniref:Ubiquitin-like domain-containing protein n=1 Tax=Panagrolaimus sp. ES5 TaxID=591445 RepID=A0AC34FQP0_9BILA